MKNHGNLLSLRWGRSSHSLSKSHAKVRGRGDVLCPPPISSGHKVEGKVSEEESSQGSRDWETGSSTTRGLGTSQEGRSWEGDNELRASESR